MRRISHNTDKDFTHGPCDHLFHQETVTAHVLRRSFTASSDVRLSATPPSSDLCANPCAFSTKGNGKSPDCRCHPSSPPAAGTVKPECTGQPFCPLRVTLVSLGLISIKLTFRIPCPTAAAAFTASRLSRNRLDRECPGPPTVPPHVRHVFRKACRQDQHTVTLRMGVFNPFDHQSHADWGQRSARGKSTTKIVAS